MCPIDYGYLEGSKGSDGAELDAWVGSGRRNVTGVLATLDLHKHDGELKLVVGCSQDEVAAVLGIMGVFMQAVYVPRSQGITRSRVRHPQVAP